MSHFYRPILWTKQSERLALDLLSDAQHDSFIPVFMVHPRKRDWDADEPRFEKSMADHLAKIPKQLAKARRGMPAFIDVSTLDDVEVLVDEVTPLQWLIEEAERESMTLWPTVSPSSPDVVLRVAKDVLSGGGRVCIRAEVDDWPTSNRQQWNDLLTLLGADHSRIDIIFDLSDAAIERLASKAISEEIAELEDRASYGSVSAGGCGLPSEPPKGKGVFEVDRMDLDVFQSSRRIDSSLGFTDYGIGRTSGGIDEDPRVLNIGSKFIYALESQWLLSRGEAFKAAAGRGKGSDAVKPMLEKLVQHPQFGSVPSDAAKEWMDDVISEKISGGSPMVWVKWGTYHHINLTLGQIASLNGPSASL